MTDAPGQRFVFFQRFSFRGASDLSLAVRCGVDEWPRLQTTLFVEEPEAAVRVYAHRVSDPPDVVPVGGIGSSIQGPYSEQEAWDVSAGVQPLPPGFEPETIVELEVQLVAQLSESEALAFRAYRSERIVRETEASARLQSLEGVLMAIAESAWERLLWRQGAWGGFGTLEATGSPCWLHSAWDQERGLVHEWVPVRVERAPQAGAGSLWDRFREEMRDRYGPPPPGQRVPFPERSELGTLKKGTASPLGHSLLREAQGVYDRQPRAAWVIAVAAMESGVKECIADLAPETPWLRGRVRDPSLRVVLLEELPKARSRALDGTVPVLSPERQRYWQDAIARRNRIVHGGGDSVLSKEAVELLIEARRLLYFLDVHRGHSWAGEYLG